MSAHRGEAELLVVVGADRDDVVFRVDERKVKIGGSTDLQKLLKDQPYNRLHVTRNYFRQQRQADLSGYRCLLNMITEPEDNARVLENVRKIARTFPGKVINRPDAVLQSTRDQVARRLANISGLAAPRAIRLRSAKAGLAARAIEAAKLQFPLILRQAGTHTGIIVGLFDDIDALQAALVDEAEHIATEYTDYRSADGLFRKYRIFFFGGQRVFRHMLVSDHWNIHGKDRKRFMASRPGLVEEEARMFAESGGAFAPEVNMVLAAVRERMPLDFFGIDFGIAPDGRVVLFEANATMSFFPLATDPQFSYLARCVEPARSALLDLLGLAPAREPMTAMEPAR